MNLLSMYMMPTLSGTTGKSLLSIFIPILAPIRDFQMEGHVSAVVHAAEPPDKPQHPE